MPHQKEKILLNALNLAFQNNFLQLASFLKHFSSYEEAWRKLSSLKKISFSPQDAWQELEKRQIAFSLLGEDNYPSLLKEIAFPPRGIYYQGNLFPEMIPLAVVGTRKVSDYGRIVTEKIVKELIPYNILIVSGLAYGVDTIAHYTAVKNGGKTIAVLGSGLDHISPASNLRLAQKIIHQGALVSEYPLGTISYPSYFPWRNRIISGLSRGTLVIEAPKKSGALITARFALEQNREVFAIPGSIFNSNSEGTNKLIQQGAKLVSLVQDILEEFNIPLKPPSSFHPSLEEEENKIYHCFSPATPLTIDKIAEKLKLPPAEILAKLSILELKGLVKSIAGGRYLKI